MTRSSVHIAPYADDDRAGVLELLQRSLGGGPGGARNEPFFAWKHFDNPFGSSFMMVARDGSRIVGLRAFMRWNFTSPGGLVRAVRAVDTSTDPDYQRRGIFSRLTTEALNVLGDSVDVVFNTPNPKSLAGYLKMGWRVVGTARPSIRVRSPLRVLGDAAGRPVPPRPTRRSSAPAAGEVLEQIDPTALLERAGRSEGRFQTDRDGAYLRWRYGRVPGLDYRAVAEIADGRPAGLAFFRLRSRGRLGEATVTDLIVEEGDIRTARSLLRRISAEAVDHLTCLFPSGSSAARAARRSGFFRGPRGMTVVANVRRDGLSPSPFDLGSWAFSLGDLEVF